MKKLHTHHKTLTSTTKARGFTLVEALVALTIISVALIACIKAAGNLNLQQDELLRRQYALWSAENFANHLRVSGTFPEAQIAQARCDQSNYQFLCKVVVDTTLNPNFRRVEVQVLDAFAQEKGNQLARLVVFVSNAP